MTAWPGAPVVGSSCSHGQTGAIWSFDFKPESGRLRRFNEDVSIDRDIMLPVSQPTMCAFAGPELDTLYVTNAADKLSDAQRRAEPHAGALLRLRPGRTGVPRRCMLASGS